LAAQLYVDNFEQGSGDVSSGGPHRRRLL
jgi:hypothetical protein